MLSAFKFKSSLNQFACLQCFVAVGSYPFEAYLWPAPDPFAVCPALFPCTPDRDRQFAPYNAGWVLRLQRLRRRRHRHPGAVRSPGHCRCHFHCHYHSRSHFHGHWSQPQSESPAAAASDWAGMQSGCQPFECTAFPPCWPVAKAKENINRCRQEKSQA